MPSPSTATTTREHASHHTLNRLTVLGAAPLLMALALWLHGPIEQWASYHHFADVHALWGMPNAANVLSNLPFLWLGIWGWAALRQPHAHRMLNDPPPSPSFWAWRLFALAIAAPVSAPPTTTGHPPMPPCFGTACPSPGPVPTSAWPCSRNVFTRVSVAPGFWVPPWL
jgi:hypothetical protein